MVINMAIYYVGNGHYDMYPEEIVERLIVVGKNSNALWIQHTHREELNMPIPHGVTMYRLPEDMFYRLLDVIICLINKKVKFLA